MNALQLQVSVSAMPKTQDIPVPVSNNLIELIQQAIQQYGSQKEAAAALDVANSSISRLLSGETRFPSGKLLHALAQFKSQVDGRPWTPRQLMAWFWELPAEEMPPDPTELARIRMLFEDGIALLENGILTIATASEKVQSMGSQASQEQPMCDSLVQILLRALRQNGLDLSKERDYKKLCKMLNAAPDEETALRLRAVVLGQETVVSGDRMMIANALKALGDATPAYELALDCQEC